MSTGIVLALLGLVLALVGLLLLRRGHAKAKVLREAQEAAADVQQYQRARAYIESQGWATREQQEGA
jgi:type II secretory pathway pseudopilin PulG